MSLITMLQKIKKEQGSIVVLTAVLLPVFLGFMGISIDVGNLYMHKARLQNVADAAALAGAREYVNQKETPDSHGKTDAEANKYINSNLDNLNNADNVTPDEKSHLVRQSADSSKTKTYYRIGLTENVGLNFLPILPGISRNATVQASAVALAEGTATSSNPLPSVPVPEGASFSIFDNLFTFSEYLFLDTINHGDLNKKEFNINSGFDGRIVYTMLNNNTETSSNPNNFFYKLGNQPNLSDDDIHIYDKQGKSGNAFVNDPYINPYFSTRDYMVAFDQWLRTDEAGNKLYYEFTNANWSEAQNCNTGFINNHLNYNVFHYNYTGELSGINIGYVNTTAKYDADTPVYIIIEGTVNTRDKSITLSTNSRPIVIVLKGTGKIFVNGQNGADAKFVIYAPDMEVVIQNANQGTYNGNIIAKRISFEGTNYGTWHMKNYLENEKYIDGFIKARKDQIEANIMANAGTTTSRDNMEGLIRALDDFLKGGNINNLSANGVFNKYANEVLALFGYAHEKENSGYNGHNNNNVVSWYSKLSQDQKRRLAEALWDYLYGNNSGNPASGGSSGGTSQSVDASSVKIRLISDSELKDTPFATL